MNSYSENFHREAYDFYMQWLCEKTRAVIEGEHDEGLKIAGEIGVKLYTARYGYKGDDRLDITVKGRDPVGKVFAPTWKMVMKTRQGKMAWEEYKEMYKELMRTSYRAHKDIWHEVLNREKVTLVCFCPEGGLCHRYLLADCLEKLGADRKGERSG